MTPPPLTGVWHHLERGLRSPVTLLLAGLAVAGGAVAGLSAGPGAHPMTGILVQLPLLVLIAGLFARAVAGRDWASLVTAVGLVVISAGGVVAGGDGGTVALDGGSVQTWSRVINGRVLDSHLGAPLVTRRVDEGLAMRLALKDREAGRAVLPLPEGHTQIGPWAVRTHTVRPAAGPTGLRLRVRPRGAETPPQTHLLGEGQTLTLPDQSTLTVRQISPDFGRALGPAAQITMEWKDAQETAWHFVQSADLDARAGASPWIVELVAVEAEPPRVLVIRRASSGAIMLVGLGVFGLGILLAVMRRRSA